MGLNLRPSGSGKLTGRDENGKKITVGQTGPGEYKGKDEDGREVAIRATGIGSWTISRGK